MDKVLIHSHALAHGVSEEDVCYAWENFLRKRHRQAPREDQILAIGSDRAGRLVQMVGVMKPNGVLIYHALTPPTAKALIELGLVRR